MTRDETRTLLTRIRRAWGQRPPEPAEVSDWYRSLRDHHADDAHLIVDRMVGESSAPPTLARIVASLRAADHPPTAPEPPPWDGPTDAGRAAIRRARQALADAR